jgi:hypothetical protein
VANELVTKDDTMTVQVSVPHSGKDLKDAIAETTGKLGYYDRSHVSVSLCSWGLTPERD